MNRDRLHHRRAILLSAASFVALYGCGNLIGPDEPPGEIYVLSPQLGSPSARRKLSFQLAVARPDASASLATDRIALRRNLTLDYYAAAQWTDASPKLMQDLLVEVLENDGALGYVARDVDGLRADFILQGALNAFEARYEHGETAPTVVVDFTARIVSDAHRQIVAAREFHQEAAAGANSIAAVVAAFNAALSQLLPDVAQWVLGAAETAPKKQS